MLLFYCTDSINQFTVLISRVFLKLFLRLRVVFIFLYLVSSQAQVRVRSFHSISIIPVPDILQVKLQSMLEQTISSILKFVSILMLLWSTQNPLL